MKKSPLAALAELEAARAEYGPEGAARGEKRLAALRGTSFSDAQSLTRFHDTLLFFRAFPQSRKVVTLTEELLADIGRQVERLRQCEADLDLFDDEEFSGIAGTTLRDTYTYEVARWLTLHFPRQLEVAWDIDEQGRQMSSSLPRVLPLLADDSLVEADTPYLEWLSSAAGGEERILPWLMQRLESMPLAMLPKTAWYDALKISIAWELGESAASRTHARRNPPAFYFHTEPLIQRRQVSLEAELAGPRLATRRLTRREGEELLDFARAALTVRYRELWGTTRGDPAQVIEADVGRGVRIFLWGLPADRRLPLRAYLAGLTVKNGVPINYIEAIGLAGWMEIGFNTFYAFRDGETAWTYAKVLRLLHQHAGITCFSVYPYQLGQDNEEAIKSGAFWFYRKLGFRPGKPELLKLTQREEKRIAATPGYRTSVRTLRRLADEHVFYEFGDGPRAVWDSFSIRNIGFAVQRRMAKKFGGDPVAMREADVASLGKVLGVKPQRLLAGEREVFADYASVLTLVPEIGRWSTAEKRSLLEIIRAKAGVSEMKYVRLMREHAKLKEVLVRLGSCDPTPQGS